jgi:small conductance mechanosensitive channel
MKALISSLSEWLDPSQLGPIALDWGGRIVAALLIFVIGRWVIGLIAGAAVRAMDQADIDETLSQFLRSLINMTLLVMVILTAVGALGVPTTNFLAILGAAGLAIGLALKDSLSNFSSGVMLVFFRPFQVGDFVEAGGALGTVVSIGIFNSIIKTGDNRVITVPNSIIYGGTITNYSAETTRRIDLVIGVGYNDDIAQARDLIMEVLNSDERILKDPAPTVMLLELADSSINFAVRPWVNSEDYWAVRAYVLEHVKNSIDRAGLSIPYPQRDVHIVGESNATA